MSQGDFSVLVVDDCRMNRLFHQQLLKKLGLKVYLAENGKVALDLHNSGAQFNLILMDMEMPVMDGPMATRQLRAMGVETNIVGVTSCVSHSELKKFVDSGLNDCVCKPLTVDRLKRFLPGDDGGSPSGDGDSNLLSN